MEALWWVLWSAICAVGTGALVYFIMQSRMEVVLAKQREKLATAQAEVSAKRESMLQSLKNVEDYARRQALDDFIADIHIEERCYVREQKTLFVHRKSLVRQERIFFRNIPLSNWVEQEMPFHEGADVEELARTMSVFSGGLLDGSGESEPVRRLLR